MAEVLAPKQIATGVHRCGTDLVNWYLVQDGGRVTVVDAGLKGYWKQLDEALGAIGRAPGDVEALVITHAHVDHLGFAGRLHRERGTPVHIHQVDAGAARKGRPPGNPLALVPQMRHGPARRFLGHITANGGPVPRKVAEVNEFSDGQVLDVPGRPRVVHTPGHTLGHCSLLFEDRGVVLAGDALVTVNPFTGVTGPQAPPDAVNSDTAQAVASLAQLESLAADVVAGGHGDPWTQGVAEAVAQARQAAEPR